MPLDDVQEAEHVDDLVEEVIGDISDEYDTAPRGRVSLETDGVLELLGALSIMDARSERRKN